MLINFAYEGLLEVECDCLQLDGHSASNLINIDRAKRAKGFLADRFIKPPANITFTFKCNVDISKIIVNPRVGSQKSSGFEILKVFRNKTTVSIAQAIINDKERVEFSRHEANGEEIVRFCSDRAGERIRQMKLKIFKTCGSTVPALGGLEIWGRPSQNVPERIKSEITGLWKSIICGFSLSGYNVHKEKTAAETVEGKISQPLPTGSKRVLRQETAVPEEFIDPISCEIMTIPMTLPSGNIVDFSTLEKFHSAEAKLGRGRSDPFTFVVFTEQNKPIAATSLKTRLDKFLLENCDDPAIRVLPRTLGKNSVVSSSSSCASSAYTTQKSFCGETSSNRTAQSVDQLLVDCLEGLPSYLGESTSISKKIKVSCAKCSDATGNNSTNNFYVFKLPCQHIVCRNCLCIMKENQDPSCAVCHQPFGFDSIQRHHV